jgi:hypothetical protein
MSRRNFIDEMAAAEGRKSIRDQDIQALWAHFCVLKKRAEEGDRAAGLAAADLIDDLSDFYRRFAAFIRNAESNKTKVSEV